MARPIVTRSGIRCARYEWQNPPYERWSQTRIQYMLVRTACADAGFLFIVTNLSNMFIISRTIYGASLCIRESIYRWGNDKRLTKRNDVFKPFSTIYPTPEIPIPSSAKQIANYIQTSNMSNIQTKYMSLITDEERSISLLFIAYRYSKQ